jgi:hypothetical protein
MNAWRGTDLVAGLLALAVLALSWYLLALPWPLDVAIGVGLAALTYLGVRLALPTPEATPSQSSQRELQGAIRASEDKIVEIRRLAGSIPQPGKEAVRAQVLRICASAEKIVGVFTHDPEKREAAEPFQNWLGQIHSIVARYVTLSSRGLESAQPALTAIERDTLPGFEEELRKLFESLHVGDVNRLLAESEAVFYRLDRIEADSRSATE